MNVDYLNVRWGVILSCTTLRANKLRNKKVAKKKCGNLKIRDSQYKDNSSWLL